MVKLALICQLVLLAYHQITTIFDFYPFNGARHHTRKENHRETITILPDRANRPAPNLEHVILQVWTRITAVVTAIASAHHHGG